MITVWAGEVGGGGREGGVREERAIKMPRERAIVRVCWGYGKAELLCQHF